jgi:hypothetical protein
MRKRYQEGDLKSEKVLDRPAMASRSSSEPSTGKTYGIPRLEANPLLAGAFAPINLKKARQPEKICFEDLICPIVFPFYQKEKLETFSGLARGQGGEIRPSGWSSDRPARPFNI